MTIAAWLIQSMSRLGEAGVDSPRRDSLVLLEDTLGRERSWVLAHADYELSSDELSTVNALIERRVDREPLAYIRGKAWFYGRFFMVNPRVLSPRPETETMIELLKDIEPKRVFDIGTGSGCIAVTAALEIPNVEVIATDKSAEALEVAKSNARLHRVTVGFIEADLVEQFSAFDFNGSTIVANLPYVPDDTIRPELSREPAEALYSGKDGLAHYRRFWQQIMNLRHVPDYILTESLKSQHDEMRSLADSAGYTLQKSDLLIQQFSR